MDDNPRDGGSDSPGPRIIRPIPRRPFALNFSAPTPPDDDDDYLSPRPQISASDLHFLNPHQHAASTPGLRDGSTPLSHTTSYLNLTAPTLFGIYSPSTTGAFSKDDDDPDADTPLDSPSPRRAILTRTATTAKGTTPTTPTTPASRQKKRELALQLLLRATLLFVLGVGYGVLVTRLPQHHPPAAAHHTHRRLAAYESHYEWRYLAFWGLAGVALGSLLPWFDRFWASPPSPQPPATTTTKAPQAIEAPLTEKPSAASPPQADWALVVRGIGAFVGIVFAIRKLPWASTMQVSLTLALANPFLWYLIDRSKPGFLLSAAVGLGGAVVLMGFGEGVLPAPTAGVGAAVVGTGFGGGNGTVGVGGGGGGGGALGGLASQEMIETGVWMLSVLFCSCVCFGNIGRRLALNSEAAGRGRWGGVR